MVWNVRSFFASAHVKGHDVPFGNRIDFGTRPFSSDVGTMAMLPEMSGGEVFIRWPIAGLKVGILLDQLRQPTMPFSPKSASG